MDTKKENVEKKPPCYNDCKYLVETLTKCKVCTFHPKLKKG